MKCTTCKGSGDDPDPKPGQPTDPCHWCSGRGYTSNDWQPGFFQLLEIGPFMATVNYSTLSEEWYGKIELGDHFITGDLFSCHAKTEQGAKDQCELWLHDTTRQMRGELPNVSPMRITERKS